MKKSKFSDTQIVSILKEAEAGMPILICDGRLWPLAAPQNQPESPI